MFSIENSSYNLDIHNIDVVTIQFNYGVKLNVNVENILFYEEGKKLLVEADVDIYDLYKEIE